MGSRYMLEPYGLALVKSLIRHVIKIVTWYGHLRDTFTGKIMAAFQKYFPLTRNLEIFYRQKCRAAAEFLNTQVQFLFKFQMKIKISNSNFNLTFNLKFEFT